MKVDRIGSDSLRVWLSDEELEKWGICYATMRQGETHTDRLIRQVTALSEQCTGRMKRGTVVEAIPVEGGCVLLVSAPRPLRVEKGPLVFRVEEVEALFRLAERWADACPGNTVPCVSLYEQDDAYAVILYPVAALTPTQKAILREYGRLTGIGAAAAAVVAEHGHLLASGNALERLAGKGVRGGDQ